MQKWITKAQNLNGIAQDTDLFLKKVSAKEIFGSNLLLGEKQVRACAPDSDSFLADSETDSIQNPWDALRASCILASKKPFSSFKVRRSRGC